MKRAMLLLSAFLTLLPCVHAQDVALASPSLRQMNETAPSILHSCVYNKYDGQPRKGTRQMATGLTFIGIGALIISLTTADKKTKDDYLAADVMAGVMIGGGVIAFISGCVKYHRSGRGIYRYSKMSVYSDANHLGLAYIFR